VISANQFAKAIANAESTQQQNQIMETINADVADMVNLLLGETPPPKTASDVQFLVTRAAGRLREVLASSRRRGE
jgi:hypothetical protein